MAIKASQCTTSTLTIEQAAAAIVELINGRFGSPRKDEIEAIVARAVGPAFLETTSFTDGQARLLEAVRECVAAERALDEAGEKTIAELTREEYEAADARFTAAEERVDKLAAELPNPLRSSADVALRAWVAFCHADKDPHGRLAGLSDDETDQAAATSARLIEAVLRSSGFSL